jgi:hypothetical protein
MLAGCSFKGCDCNTVTFAACSTDYKLIKKCGDRKSMGNAFLKSKKFCPSHIALHGKPPLPFELLKEKQDEFEAELQADKERKRNSYSSFDSIHFTMSV